MNAAQRREQELRDQYAKGHQAGADYILSKMHTEIRQQQLAIMRAAAEMLKESGQVLSRTGYMLDKLNGVK